MFLNVFCAASFPSKPGKVADEEAGEADVAAADRDVRGRVDPLSRAARAAVHHEGTVRPCRDAAGSRGSKPARAPRRDAQDEDKWVCDAAFARLVREVLRDLARCDSLERGFEAGARDSTTTALQHASEEFASERGDGARHQTQQHQERRECYCCFCDCFVCVDGEATEQAREQPPPTRFICVIACLLVCLIFCPTADALSLNRFTVALATWLLDCLLACFVSSRSHFVLLFVCLCSCWFACFFCLFACWARGEGSCGARAWK